MSEWCHIYERVMSHLWTSHVTYMNFLFLKTKQRANCRRSASECVCVCTVWRMCVYSVCVCTVWYTHSVAYVCVQCMCVYSVVHTSQIFWVHVSVSLVHTSPTYYNYFECMWMCMCVYGMAKTRETLCLSGVTNCLTRVLSRVCVQCSHALLLQLWGGYD